MKLLLVDDDKIVLDSMPSSYPWQDWGITEIRTAWSIRQAKEILGREQMDILLCDIEMPMGTGIELVEWIQENPQISLVTILLTCHSEFRYARRALQLGCSNYLLKPAEERELKAAILDAEEKVAALRRSEREQKRKERQHQDMDHFWETVFTHRITGEERLRRLCGEYGIREEACFTPVLISMKHHSFRVRDVSRSLMSFIMENVVREVLKGQTFALLNGNNERLWLLFAEKDPQDLSSLFSEMIVWMEKNYHCAVSCYQGRKIFLTDWMKECEKLSDADERFAKSPEIYSSSQIRRRCRIQSELTDGEKNHFVNLFSSGKYAELLQRMEQYFQELLPEQCSMAFLRSFAHQINREFEREMEQKTDGRFQKVQMKLCEENRDHTASVPGLMEYYGRMFELLKKTDEEKTPEEVVSRVKLYISMNIRQPLGREEVAASVGLHPDYLNRIFKKETGLPLKEYIADKKIQIACDLLTQTDFQIGEIGEMVGYVNFSSFTTFFKNRTGLTPAGWRKEHLK